MNEGVKERFLRYVAYPTMSDEVSKTCPSSQKQWALARQLTQELLKMGLDAYCDEHCYVYGKLPSNLSEPVKKVGFMLHDRIVYRVRTAAPSGRELDFAEGERLRETAGY